MRRKHELTDRRFRNGRSVVYGRFKVARLRGGRQGPRACMLVESHEGPTIIAWRRQASSCLTDIQVVLAVARNPAWSRGREMASAQPAAGANGCQIVSGLQDNEPGGWPRRGPKWRSRREEVQVRDSLDGSPAGWRRGRAGSTRAAVPTRNRLTLGD